MEVNTDTEQEDAGDADLWAEQQAILDSLQSEAEANCHIIQAVQETDIDEMLVYMDEEEEPAPDTKIVDIFDEDDA